MEHSKLPWDKIDKQENGCWIWLGAKTRVRYKYCDDVYYASARVNGKVIRVHRWLYELLRGSVPVGLELDHLCRNTLCVNPDHLEPVTHSVNVRRGISGEMNKIKAINITHCPQGHEYTPENTAIFTDGTRHCKECGRIRAREYQRKTKHYKVWRNARLVLQEAREE